MMWALGLGANLLEQPQLQPAPKPQHLRADPQARGAHAVAIAATPHAHTP